MWMSYWAGLASCLWNSEQYAYVDALLTQHTLGTDRKIVSTQKTIFIRKHLPFLIDAFFMPIFEGGTPMTASKIWGITAKIGGVSVCAWIFNWSLLYFEKWDKSHFYNWIR